MSGFAWANEISGGGTNDIVMVVKDAEVITAGMLLKVTSGEVEKATSGASTIIGVALEDVDNTADGESIKLRLCKNQVWKVADSSARIAGAHLDLGADGVSITTDSNHDFVVVKDSSASEPTLVMVTESKTVFG